MEELRNNRQLQLIVGVALAAICALAFYFLYWTKTPEYSLGIIKDAVKNHDTVKFQQHVDLDTLIGKAFDAYMTAEAKKDNQDISSPLAKEMIGLFKSKAVEELKNDVLRAIGENQSSGGQKGAASGQLTGLSKIQNMGTFLNVSQNEVKKVSTVSENGSVAIVSITVHSRQVDKDYDIRIQMNKLGNGEWLVKEIVNMEKLVLQNEADKAEKLKQLDEPIRKQIYGTLKTSVNARVYRGIVDNKLEIHVGLQNTGSKQIAGAKGKIIFLDTGNKSRVFKNVQLKDWGYVSKDQYTMSDNYMSLNSFDSNDSEFAERALNGQTNTIGYQLEIMELDFTDGTKLVRPTELPSAN